MARIGESGSRCAASNWLTTDWREVQRAGWISRERFMHAFAFSLLQYNESGGKTRSPREWLCANQGELAVAHELVALERGGHFIGAAVVAVAVRAFGAQYFPH